MKNTHIDQEFELPVKLIEQIKAIAEENNITIDEIVAEAIINHISKKEKEKNEN